VILITLAGAAGAALLGIALAFVIARILRVSRNAGLQIVATIVGAYGAYFAADYLHMPGIFATISCGIALRYFERHWITLSIAEDVNRFWDVSALLANVLVFFMVGASLAIERVAHDPIFVVACLIAIAVARLAVGGLLLPAPYPRAWIDVVRVAGMRGALSLVLALALPAWVPYREAIIDAAFAVALATLAASTFTVVPVTRRAAR
jgi:monovalent cation:H+ antiporter, CPA1 family